MAIDNEQNQRSFAPLPFYTTLPLEDGGIDQADQLHFTWIYRELLAAVAVSLPPTTFSRQEVHVVSLSVAGTQSGPQVFFFSPKLAPPVNLILGLDVRPYLLSFGGRPTRIEPDKAITQRASMSLTFAEDDNAPDFDSTIFKIFKGGAFWRRLVRAQPDYIGSVIEVKRGFLATLTTFAAMTTIFKGRVEAINFSSDETVTVKAKDDLALQDVLLPAKITKTNVPASAVTPSTDVITVTDATEITDPANLPSKDFFPVTLRLTPDSIPFLLAGASWTAASRILTETNAFVGYNHRDGDQIFLSGGSPSTITDGLFTIAAKITDSVIQLQDEIFATDLTLIVSRPQEDIILGSRTTTTVTVQENQADESEDFSDAVWTGSATVTVDQDIGPFGGDSRADLLSFAFAGTSIRQDTGAATGGLDWVCSVWFRRRADATADETITIQIDRVAGGGDLTKLVTVTKDWKRFEITNLLSSGSTVRFTIRRNIGDAPSVLAFGAAVHKGTTRGFYAATTGGSNGTTAGRLAFGGVGTGDHAAGTRMAEVLTYRTHLDPEVGVHPVVVERDLVNRILIPVASVDQSSFDTEFDLVPGSQVRRATFTSVQAPKRARELLQNLRQQTMLDLWVSETGLVTTRFNFRQTLPGVTIKALTHEANVLFRTLSIDNNEESRITRIFVFFDAFRDNPDDKPEDFNDAIVKVELGVESASGTKSRRIFADWISNGGDALALVGRLLGRFKRAARVVSCDLDLSDEPDFTVGDIVTIDSPDILVDGAGGSAVRSPVSFQVTQRTHKRSEGRIGLEALETSGQKTGFISPNDSLTAGAGPFPDFPGATDAERQYGFIGDNQNKLASALVTAPFNFSAATYTASQKRIAEIGAFASYTFTQGDALFALHSSVHPAFYLIASKVSDDAIDLAVTLKEVGDGFTDSGDISVVAGVGVANDVDKFRSQLVDGYVIL